MRAIDALDTRQVATWLSRLRVGLGALLLATPRTTTAVLTGAVRSPAGVAATRVAGIRDAALGAGSAIAIGQRRGGGDWMSMLAMVDLGDALVFLFGPRLPVRARVFGVLAAGSAAVHLALARDLATQEHATVDD